MVFKGALTALAIGAFGIGVTEFAPMGMLPVIASGLHVTIPAAGWLVTAYALGVMAGAPLVTLSTARLDRRTLLIGLVAIFTAGNLLSALSPSLGWLLAARVLTSLCHGAFFGVGSLVAAASVEPKRRSSAVALMFSGLTIANIGGVPMAAWLAEHVGWRTAFAGIGALGFVAMGALALALPATPGAPSSNAARELSNLARPPVLMALLTTVLSSAAMFTVFTYIAPILENAAQASADLLTVALVVYGVGLTVGNALGGRFADRALTPNLLVVLAALTALLVLFAWTMHAFGPAVLTVFAWGVATFALVPPLQARIMNAASGAPTLASSVNIGAFNLGNAAGAALGGAIIAARLGYAWVSFAGAAQAAAAFLTVLVSRRIPQAT